MGLAKMGLGLGEVRFDADGDATHVHLVIMETYPVLESCGGYTLLRLSENSHSMVEIEGPDGGVTVHFLKDVLNQAKMYIRPLQKDITIHDMRPYLNTEVRLSFGFVVLTQKYGTFAYHTYMSV